MTGLVKAKKVFPCCIFVIFIFLLIQGLSFRGELPDIMKKSQEKSEFIIWDSFQKEGVSQTKRYCYRIDHRITVRKVLNAETYKNPCLLIGSTYSKLIVWLDGKEIYYFSAGTHELPVTRMLYLFVDLPQGYIGKELVLEMRSSYPISYMRDPTVIIGNRTDIVTAQLKKELSQCIIGILIFLMGSISIITSLILNIFYKIPIKEGNYVGKAYMCIGGWLITECRLIVQFLNNYVLMYYINYFCFYFGIIFLIQYLGHVENKKWKKRLKRITIFCRYIFYIGTLGEVTHKFGYLDMQMIWYPAAAIGLGMAILAHIRSKDRGRQLLSVLYFCTFIIDGFFFYPKVYRCFGIGVGSSYLTIVILLCFILNRYCIFFSGAVREQVQNQTLKIHLKTQVQHYTSMMQSYKDLTIFRHDMKNRMLSIYTLLDLGMNKECINYLGKLLDEMKRPEKYFETGNPVLDAILTEKQKETIHKNIIFQTNLKIPRQLDIKDDDWITIIGNLIDNAIEATEKIKSSAREISLTLAYRYRILFIQIENMVESPCVNFKVTSKRNAMQHGYGLLSIRKALKKYQGSFDISTHGCKCVAEVHLECAVKEKNV